MTHDDATARARAWWAEHVRPAEWDLEEVNDLATLLRAVAREAQGAALEEARTGANENDAFFGPRTALRWKDVADWLRRRASALREGR